LEKLHEIRLRSDRFIANIDQKIEESILFVESEVVDINRRQMKEKQIDSLGNNLPEYSSFWKSVKGLTYFNLFSTGSFQQLMFMTVKYPTFKISSGDWKLGRLLAKVGERMFGIAPSNRDETKRITFKGFSRKYRSQVLNK
jgi:hypothetical protein